MRRFAIAAALLASSSVADARSEKTLAYPRDQAWPTAVRFVRVDEHLKIVEKDSDAGYVLFELKEDKQTFRGSLEVIDATVDGRHVVKFIVEIADRPSWTEIAMLTRLEHKLREELGAPAPTPTPDKKPKPKGDDDAPKKDPPKGDEPGAGKDDPPPSDGPPISPTP